MIAIHKNTLDQQKWSYEVDSGDAIFALQKLSSVIRVDCKSTNGNCTFSEASILIIYTDKF